MAESAPTHHRPSSSLGSTVRVLAWPARRKRADNPYSFLVQQSTAPHGITTTEFGPKALFGSRWDIIHIHWPDMVLLRGGALRQAVTGALLLLVLRCHRALGARLVWTVHNVLPHELTAPRVARWFMRSFAATTDGIISPSRAGLSEALEAYPTLATRPAAVVPIGSYASEYCEAPGRLAARETLGLDANASVFLAFGMIRSYKNLPHLAASFRALEDPLATLIIAGPPKDTGEVELLRKHAAADPRIRLIAERVDDACVPALFAAADHFVAPFSSILNSSSLLLALTYGCRAIAPATGGLPEVAEAVGPDWVTLFDGQFTTGHLAAALDAGPPPSGSPNLSSFDWERLGADTAAFFRSLAEPSDIDTAVPE